MDFLSFIFNFLGGFFGGKGHAQLSSSVGQITCDKRVGMIERTGLLVAHTRSDLAAFMSLHHHKIGRSYCTSYTS